MRKNLMSLALILSLILGATSAFAAPLGNQLAENSMINQVIKKGVLRVGISTFVPWTMADKNGEFIGFEIDVAKRLAQDLGVEVEFVPTEFAGIIPALLTGKFDIIVGSMSIRMDRALKVNFSLPYDYSGMDILASKTKAEGFKTLEDFNKPEVTIALRSGAASIPAVKKHLPKAELRFFDDEAMVIQEVAAGRAHAMISSMPLPAFKALEEPDKFFAPLDKPFTHESIAFAVKKGDPDSLNVLDTWVRMATNDGWLEERHQYWFASHEWKNLVE